MSTETDWVPVTDAAENARYLYGLLEKEKLKPAAAVDEAVEKPAVAAPTNGDEAAEDDDDSVPEAPGTTI